ncbi:MAG: phosphohydrolase [Blastopirellula sp.]|nr:MAG: phosphohydrolase [Blastopirellula sp.]
MSEKEVNIKELLAGAQLPALPQSAIRLLELSQDPENGPAEFALPIESDPGLTGQVLRFVNSSYFGFSREISSVKLAITLVGIRTIKNFALWSAVFSLMPNPKSGPFDLKNLWQDSLRRGLFSRTMGKILGLKDAEDLFAAALLQDMAVPLLAKEMPEKYEALINGRHHGEKRLSTLEKEAFGWNHAEAGGVIARGWSLPEEFAVLIESHVDLDEHLAQSKPDPGKISVALSALLPATNDESWSERDEFEKAYNKIKGDGPALLDLLGQIDADYEEFAPVLKLTAPTSTLVQSYESVTEEANT